MTFSEIFRFSCFVLNNTDVAPQQNVSGSSGPQLILLSVF